MTILNFAARALFLHFVAVSTSTGSTRLKMKGHAGTMSGGKRCEGKLDVFSRVKASCFCILILIPRPSIPATSYNRACCMINSYICSALSECTVCMSLPLPDLIQDHSWYHDIKLLSHISLNCLIAMALLTIAPESPHRRSSPGCLCSSSYAAGHRVACTNAADLWRGPALRANVATPSTGQTYLSAILVSWWF